MSLDVPADLLDRGRGRRRSTTPTFVDCVRDSLPYAWTVISDAGRATCDRPAPSSPTTQTPPPSEAERGQLLRALASDAIRGALERHFGVRLAFQNCHRVAAFAPAALDGALRRSSSPRAPAAQPVAGTRDC